MRKADRIAFVRQLQQRHELRSERITGRADAEVYAAERRQDGYETAVMPATNASGVYIVTYWKGGR